MKNYREKKVIMSKEELSMTIKRLAHEIVEKNFGIKDIAVIGIQTRGVFIGKRIINEIFKSGLADSKENIPFGVIDITLYRDDMGTVSKMPVVKETNIPFDITNKKLIVVDDVIFTGRSIRAALDELIDFGRPRNIQLAVVIDRGHRELPIEPNFVGRKFHTSREELIKIELEEVDGQDKVILKEEV